MQSRTFEKTVHVLRETTLDKLQLKKNHLIMAADLGYSCGQNILIVADLIVQHMAELYRSRNHPPPEFCFYFNDLPKNDFNTLFRILPEHSRRNGSQRQRYFGAGVPGSFYDRLFPERFIEVFTSTFSLHWLSQVYIYGSTSNLIRIEFNCNDSGLSGSHQAVLDCTYTGPARSGGQEVRGI